MAISFTEEIQPIYQNNAQIPEKIVRVSNISIILFFVRDYYMEVIETLFPQIESGSMIMSIGLGILLFLIVTAINQIAIRRKVMSIWKRKE